LLDAVTEDLLHADDVVTILKPDPEGVGRAAKEDHAGRKRSAKPRGKKAAKDEPVRLLTRRGFGVESSGSSESAVRACNPLEDDRHGIVDFVGCDGVRY
jgi:hypothetical protein